MSKPRKDPYDPKQSSHLIHGVLVHHLDQTLWSWEVNRAIWTWRFFGHALCRNGIVIAQGTMTDLSYDVAFSIGYEAALAACQYITEEPHHGR